LSGIVELLLDDWRRGIICFLLHHGQLYRFATYNGATMTQMSLDQKVLAVSMSRREYRLQLKAAGGSGGFFKAPKNGLMSRTIKETITSMVEVNLYKGQELVRAATAHGNFVGCGASAQPHVIKGGTLLCLTSAAIYQPPRVSNIWGKKP
jgi:hypothetical protein